MKLRRMNGTLIFLCCLLGWQPLQAESDKQFAKLVGFYWIGVMGLLFVAVCLAILDFWAARKYWITG